MNIESIKSLIYISNLSHLTYFEYKSNDIFIKIVKKNTDIKFNNILHGEISCTEQEEVKYKIVSEYVGVIILLNNKTLQPFVTLGKLIKKGELLCIIHYVNIPIKILSPYDGVISGICVANKTLIDYGKTIFEVTCNKK